MITTFNLSEDALKFGIQALRQFNKTRRLGEFITIARTVEVINVLGLTLTKDEARKWNELYEDKFQVLLKEYNSISKEIVNCII